MIKVINNQKTKNSSWSLITFSYISLSSLNSNYPKIS